MIRNANKFEFNRARALSKTYDSRLIYITDGSGSMTVDGRGFELEKGVLAVFQGGTAYKFTPRTHFSAYVVDFDLTRGYEYGDFMLPVAVSAFDETKLHTPVIFENSRFLEKPFIDNVGLMMGDELRRLIDEYTSGRIFSRRRAEMMLDVIFLGLAQRLTRKSNSAMLCERVLDYINEHYCESVKNTSVADILGYDPCYLNRTVKLCTGSSIHRLLNRKRVDAGIALLMSTDYPLSRIAEQVGFSSASHFLKVCKEMTGRNPSFYRQ